MADLNWETNDEKGNRGVIIPATDCPAAGVETELARLHCLGGVAYRLDLRGLFDDPAAWVDCYIRIVAANRELIIDSQLFDNVRDISLPFKTNNATDIVISAVNNGATLRQFSGYASVWVK